VELQPATELADFKHGITASSAGSGRRQSSNLYSIFLAGRCLRRSSILFQQRPMPQSDLSGDPTCTPSGAATGVGHLDPSARPGIESRNLRFWDRRMIAR
jgi:hypothetical protein